MTDAVITILDDAKGTTSSAVVFAAPLDVKERKNTPPKWRWYFIIGGSILFGGFLVVVTVATALILTASPSSESPVATIEFPVSPGKLGAFPKAAAAANAGPCSQIGKDIMQQHGGSAVDGAIAATICTSVLSMHSAGIGGGFFLTYWDNKAQKAYVLNARETAPAAATQDMFDDGTSSTTGAFAIAIPGEVIGYWEAHQRFGRAPWRTLYEPSIKLCREGFKVSEALANAIVSASKRIAGVQDPKPFANLMHFFINKATGKSFVAGETMYCPKLADTFERIANSNGTDYYNGSLAEDVIADLDEVGSIITKEDLALYAPKWQEPVDMMVADRYRLVSVRPPGSGAVLGFMLNILAGYKFDTESSQDTLTYHRYVEALKFAYGQRMVLGDEDFEPQVKEIGKNLTSPALAEQYRLLIDDVQTHQTPFYLPPTYASPANDHGTAHIAIVDDDGNAASLTSTINTIFASAIMGSRTGIIFNNEMDDFSKTSSSNDFNYPPSPANFIVPGKRPQSSMCPAIFLVPEEGTDKYKLALVVGGAGGSRITSGTAYVATRIFWFGENPKQAIDALRLHHQLLPELLYYEKGMPPIILDSLHRKGHVNQTESTSESVIQAIQVLDDGTKLAYSDYRRNNAYPDGY